MRLYPLLGIDPEVGQRVTESWERREPAVYGRFDLIYDGTAPPKLLEYNADTPTSLFEAAPRSLRPLIVTADYRWIKSHAWMADFHTCEPLA